MEEADKDWMMIRMVGGWVFLLVPAHPGSPGQRAVKRLLLLLLFPLLSFFRFPFVLTNNDNNGSVRVCIPVTTTRSLTRLTSSATRAVSRRTSTRSRCCLMTWERRSTAWVTSPLGRTDYSASSSCSESRSFSCLLIYCDRQRRFS